MAKFINFTPFKEFLKSGSIGGIILFTCVFISLVISNSPLGPGFSSFLSNEVGVHTESIHLRYSILLWINDGLMAIFFLLVGLEIKRELVEGELASFKQASLPILAAMGGAVFPAAVYFLLNRGTETATGWGIPMATDIAFALAIITILGSKIPSSLKIFLTAVVIVDDLMTILVIAIFYSAELSYIYMLYAAGIFVFLLILNKAGVKNLAFYLIPGVFIWYFIHHSGVHATIAGVLTAFAIPTTGDATESPLERLEHMLLKPVNFIIMPIFALANTNIVFEDGMIDGLGTSLGLGIMLGLIIGKPVGITLLSFLAVRLGIANMPTGASWRHIAGVGLLGGIGFTMSIFIALLSFAGEDLLLPDAKFSILIGSVISGTLGYLVLSASGKPAKD